MKTKAMQFGIITSTLAAAFLAVYGLLHFIGAIQPEFRHPSYKKVESTQPAPFSVYEYCYKQNKFLVFLTDNTMDAVETVYGCEGK